MLNLSKGIYGKLSGSALASHIGTRMYGGRAKQGAAYPYVVYLIPSDVPDPTFSSNYEDYLIQFSLFSSTSSSTEVKNMYTDLKTLYDDCTMTIAAGANTLIWMQRVNATLMAEEHTLPTPIGTVKVWHLAVDYMATVKV